MSLSIKAQAAIAGDPKRDDIYPMPKAQADPEKQMPDVLLIIAMLAGMGSMLAKIKILSWVALIFLSSSVVNAGPAYDYKQLIQTLMFTLFGLGSNYFLPMYQRNKMIQEVHETAAWLAANPQ
uniref:Uncharacterized protein n=1 Tax=Chlamydomonas leiostraca TaxID=1034604 RepID=A0A7S0RRQ3_9CHLO|mmetsp:Transcript_28807/g.73447  ORF Transcript_28807/g.73447 Transcript_28807/m.73447 type:complete len:123 (+) Transcript_28807:49-417(+)